MCLFDENSDEYKEIDYRIKCTQYYQQECIDSAKQGEPPKPIPSYWHNFNDEKLKIKVNEETGEILNTEEELKEIELYKNVLTEKKPYYFIYIYDHLMKEHNDFIKSVETNCARRFRCRINELKQDTDEKKEFLEWYEKKSVVSNNPCIVNKISKIVENEFPRRDRVLNEDVDYKIYLDNSKEYEIGTSTEIKSIKEVYNEYKNSKKNEIAMDYNDKGDSLKEANDRKKELIEQLHLIIPNEDNLLYTMITLSYIKNVISKAFTWDVVGSLIIKNMLNNNNKIIKYPIKDNEGYMLYGKNKFKMVEKIL